MMLDAGYGSKPMNYKDLDIWKIARELVIEIHEMTLIKLPKKD